MGIWREHNARSFEDRETLVVELKKIMFNSLFTWIVAHNSLFVFSSFLAFLGVCSSFSS
jgi:hypothetical protein